nr:hypothetical protein [Sphingomonas pruni]
MDQLYPSPIDRYNLRRLFEKVSICRKDGSATVLSERRNPMDVGGSLETSFQDRGELESIAQGDGIYRVHDRWGDVLVGPYPQGADLIS